MSEPRWNLEAYVAHNEALRAADERFQVERDRRYAEVADEREKARRVKETADLAALALAREIQTYKDEKANELREQINSERGLYASKNDLIAMGEKFTAQLKPMNDFMAASGGHSTGAKDLKTGIAWIVALLASLIAIGSFVFRAQPAERPEPQIIYVPAQPGTLIPSPSQQQGPPR